MDSGSNNDFDMLNYIKGELFDHALLFGMSADEYWFGDPSLIYSYQNAFNLKQEYELQLAWTQGAYFKSALASTIVWATLPSKPSDLHKMPKYADNPIEKMQPRREMTEENKRLMSEMQSKLTAMGLWRT